MLEEFFQREAMIYTLGTFLGLVILYFVVIAILRKLGKNPRNIIPTDTVKKTAKPIFLIFLSFLLRMKALRELTGLEDYEYYFRKGSSLLLIFAITWLIIQVITLAKDLVVQQYDMNTANNLRARKVYTQFNILERIAVFLLIILALGIALMSFESIREIGVSIFASAGVAGIIIGFSAQKMIGTILAGIQIALTQPIKIDDVVIVEGEWGRIEEIRLTYVVIAIWDKRRLVVPTTYFIDTPFQNWTKTSSDILGTVYLYLDYTVPFDQLRDALTRTLENTELWDKKVNNIQVTDSKPHHVEVRALMSAKDSPTAWDLRVHVREQLITFLQSNYPDSLAKTRVFLKNPEGQGNTEDN
ncbi:MAG: mechanosensitive ion channel [Flavobacteriaceae bacterium]|nr:mechanosensitive ion channel [Flavobacteriaceae bacterium]